MELLTTSDKMDSAVYSVSRVLRDEESDDDEDKFKKNKWKDVVINIMQGFKKVVQVLLLIYFFMCGIDVLTSSFKLMGGKNINALTEAGTLKNPLAGLIVGVLVTIMVQSSSTSTAIIVSLVSSGIIDIDQAIPVIMGSNIGTSVTNSFVSFTQVTDRKAFERAFAGATVHDMFNFLSVTALLSFEIITRSIPGSRGFLEYITELVVNATYNEDSVRSDEPAGLKEIISPVTMKIIKINKKILECWARNESESVTTIIEHYCDPPVYSNLLFHDNKTLATQSTTNQCPHSDRNGTIPCCFLFAGSTMSDATIGIILLLGSLTVLIFCLITLVRVLNAILKGPVQEIVKKYINSDIPCAPRLTGYLALFVGAVMTIIMQSSSIFTSLLTPLIGMGIVSMERCYPLTLGSNIGTTTTALLAAFTENEKASIQIALVHLFFNFFGILLFYPIPYMRFPINMATRLGRITATYRWFAIVYILSTFLVIPGLLLALSNSGPTTFWVVMGTLVFIAVIVFAINILQHKSSSCLPVILRTWDFLPEPLRSLEPYDRLIHKAGSCCSRESRDKKSTTNLPQMVLTQSVRSIGSHDSGIDNVIEGPDYY